MCRIYNDCKSVRRDRKEGNLNSVDFPDSVTSFTDSNPANGANGVQSEKNQLLQIAQHERQCMLAALKKLEPGLKGEHGRSLGLFVDVTDLFGQIYVAKDIGVVTGKQS